MESVQGLNLNRRYISELEPEMSVTICILESYLYNPYQMLRIKDRSPVNNESKWGLVKHGVPQGFILGPLFFLLYIKNLPKVTNYLFSKVNSKTILFADDTSVIVSNQGNTILECNLTSVF